MSNVSAFDALDVEAIESLMLRAAKNEWYHLAEQLRRARDEAKERLRHDWADGVVDDIVNPE